MTAVRYIDFNRGSDSNDGSSPDKAWKNLSMAANFAPGAGGGLLLACDSIWELLHTPTISYNLLQTQFNGAAGNRAFITSYKPAGAAGTTKPTIRARMIPQPSDWLWDPTLNGPDGDAKGWYIQLNRNSPFWDLWFKVGDQYVGTTNQNTDSSQGYGYINTTKLGGFAGQWVNGMNRDTLRFNMDFSGASVQGQYPDGSPGPAASTNTRIYLSGLGLHTQAVGQDPSSIYGPGQIVIGFGSFFSFYDSGNYCVINDLRFEYGGGMITMQGTDNTVKTGLEIYGCEFYETSIPFRINSGYSTAANTNWKIDIHDNVISRFSGPAFAAYGAGISGSYRNNKMYDGNLCSSMGGATYCQIEPSTYSGIRDPFYVQYNLVRRMRNGAGNNEFDGSCYYADVHDNGTIHLGNLALDSYAAFQCGSGKKSEWYSNIAINCEQFAMFNNAPTIADNNDYTFANNLFVACARGTFPHGQTANVHQYHMPWYEDGVPADLVGAKIVNNVLINHPANVNEIPLMAYTAAQWASGKVVVNKNLFVGYNGKLVVSDLNVENDQTAHSGSLPANTVTNFRNQLAGDFRLGAGSALIGAGVDISRSDITDFEGKNYFAAPSVGPFEVNRVSDWFGLRT
jgi:hypothetical protein